ncbi:GNAT family N-acetyltransferase [Mesorhizobium sp. BH1-1-5]|uniref:GNAT family N-acetyltransferase n=1 Tax=Mesorhizobium sp. BH1-1-5 TaxID=2876661 RepID=UPI001CC9A61C|nr:GNAT family N-acetyltransferase [Mesorhizobium sp. BH1-1-5]MBZ9990843.1 GNAT family N-acetyltransferase [Mesorhizobium sp. BH1-1-5]
MTGALRASPGSWVCGDVWFLAQLFVDPGRQDHGIGNTLLERTMEHARTSGAAHKALITFTFNRVLQGLYMRHGLFPKTPNYILSAPRERVTRALARSPLHAVEIDGSAATIVGNRLLGQSAHIVPDDSR